MTDLDLQQFLFSSPPSRADLLSYAPAPGLAPARIYVARNHAFENVASAITPYAAYAGIAPQFIISDYDDSLSFAQFDASADMALLWLDMDHYHTQDVAGFLSERVQFLRQIFSKPILVAALDAPPDLALPLGCHIVDIPAIAAPLGDALYDMRLASFSGTRLSGPAGLALARALGCVYLPACLGPALKAIVVDLDNTLYRGVLGEDGIQGVCMDPGHAALQARLKTLAAAGCFLCVASKNDMDDVRALFAQRSDFPLQWDDFTHVLASWQPKSDSIAQIKTKLNIHEDSMVFIDDNPGEIAAVCGVFPGIHTILAQADAQITADVVDVFPRLNRLVITQEDALRKQDSQANQERQRLQSTLSIADYIRSIDMRLTLRTDPVDLIARTAELASKTNQFIFSYRRYKPDAIAAIVRAPDTALVALSLRDKLSDSGMIGACVLRDAGGYAVLDELFISCRALGRGIDDVMVFEALRLGLAKLGLTRLAVTYTKGDRNAPAVDFVCKYLSPYLNGPADFTANSTDLPLTIAHED